MAGELLDRDVGVDELSVLGEEVGLEVVVEELQLEAGEFQLPLLHEEEATILCLRRRACTIIELSSNLSLFFMKGNSLANRLVLCR